MTCPEGQFEKTCRAQFAELHGKLDRLDEAIRGNGRPGIYTRLDRLERSEATRSKLMWAIATSVVSLAAAAVWKLIFEA